MNREIELLKIQVYVGYCHSTFRVQISFIFGALVAILVSLMGLFFQKAINVVTYYGTLLLCVPFFAFYVVRGYRNYQKSLGKVDNMIEHVDNGNSLPSIKDMIKGKEKVNETSVEENSKMFDFFGQAFFLFYGLIFGLLVGVWGNLWATIFFEHIIRSDASLMLHFWVATAILIGLIAFFVIMIFHFYGKMKKIAERKE